MSKLHRFGLWLVTLVALFVGAMGNTAAAQDTGTNTVTLVANNLTNGANTVIPIAIGIGVVMLVWGLVRSLAKRAR